MDRLETSRHARHVSITENLYSSMDRLETQSKNLNYTVKALIYIPVWIDQKHEYRTNRTFTSFNLYSSMDRLETPIYDVTMRVIFNNLYSSMDRLETYNEMRIRNDIV